jgi:hypothetical protein
MLLPRSVLKGWLAMSMQQIMVRAVFVARRIDGAMLENPIRYEVQRSRFIRDQHIGALAH